MNATRALREIFESALLLPTGERAAYLDRECADPERRLSVERMLAAHGDDSLELLDRSLVDVASKLTPADALLDAGDWVGRTIGGFLLVEAIGAGGS
jgi:hypothetical protein